MTKLPSCLLLPLLLGVAAVSATFSDVATDACNVPVGFLDDEHNVTQRFWCNDPTNASNTTNATNVTNATRRLGDDGFQIPNIWSFISSGINAYNMIQKYVNPDSQNCEVVTSLLPDNQVCDWYWSSATNQYICRNKWQTKMKFAFTSNTNKQSEFWVNSENANSPTDSFYQARTRSGNLGSGEGLRSVSFSFRASSCLKYIAVSCGTGISAANEANLVMGVNWIYEKLWREGKTNMARCGPFSQGQNFPGLDYVLGLTLSGAAFACGTNYDCILANTQIYGFPVSDWK